MICWLRILKNSWTQGTNESIQQIKLITRPRTIIAENIAKFFDHVVRKNGFERLTVEGMIAEKRPHGTKFCLHFHDRREQREMKTYNIVA